MLGKLKSIPLLVVQMPKSIRNFKRREAKEMLPVLPACTYIHLITSALLGVHVCVHKRQRLPGSLMKGGIPRNGCLTQWRRR